MLSGRFTISGIRRTVATSKESIGSATPSREGTASPPSPGTPKSPPGGRGTIVGASRHARAAGEEARRTVAASSDASAHGTDEPTAAAALHHNHTNHQSTIDLSDLEAFLGTLAQDHIAAYLMSRVDPNEKVVAGIVTHTNKYKPVELNALGAERDENVIEVSVVAVLKARPGSISDDELAALAHCLLDAAEKKFLVKLLTAVLAAHAHRDTDMALLCACAARVLAVWQQDHDVVRLGLALARRLLPIDARQVAERCGDVLQRLVAWFSKDDMKTLALVNVLLGCLGHAQPALVVDAAPVVVDALENLMRNGFPMQVHMQVQASGIGFLCAVAASQDLIPAVCASGAPAYVAKLFRALHGTGLALERCILDLLCAVALDAGTHDDLIALGVHRLAWDALERQPVRAAKLMALLSAGQKGSLAVLGLGALADRLTRLVMVDDVAGSAVVVGKNVALFSHDFLRELRERRWLERVVELFARCCAHSVQQREDATLALDLTSFMIIATAVSGQAANALVELNVVPAALNLVLQPNLPPGAMAKVFALLDHVVSTHKGAVQWCEHKGVSIAVSVLCNHPEDAELVRAVVLCMDHCAALNADMAARVNADGGRDAVEAIGEAYADDADIARLCNECVALLAHAADSAPRRVFAASSVYDAASAVDSSGDPLHAYRNMLLAGTLVTEWAGRKHAPKHVSMGPDMNLLVFKDVGSAHSRHAAAAPSTLWLRDLRSCHAGGGGGGGGAGVGSGDAAERASAFTLVARGGAKVLECADADECREWVAAMQVILHLVRTHDTKWLHLNQGY